MIFYSRISLFFLLVLIAALTQAQTHDFEQTDSIIAKTKLLPLTLNDSIIDYGKLFLNAPYRYGSKGEKSFDCSGFTSHVFKNFGYNLERSSADQARQTPSIQKEDVKKGDLVFFEGRRRNGNVGHVGIVVETTDCGNYNFIHAAVRSGVTISSSKEPYYAKRFVKVGRVIHSDSALNRLSYPPDFKNITSNITGNISSITLPAVYHKVRKGENLSSIAQKHRVSISTIKKLNNLRSTHLQINQNLKIKDKVILKATEREIAMQKQGKNHTDNSTEEILQETPEIATNQINASSEQSIKTFSANAGMPIEKNQKKKIHKVIKGETLYNIARANNISVNKLKELNNLPDGKIMPGQKLKISEENTQTRTEANNNSEQYNAIHHVVLTGESLSTIARIYNVAVEKIKTANNLSGSKIRAGQVLKIYQVQNVL